MSLVVTVLFIVPWLDFVLCQLTVACHRLRFAITVGTVASLFVGACVFMVYIPSAISTILAFRSGLIGSLKDPNFAIYRKAQDLSTMMVGAAFWGAFFCLVVTLIVVSVLAFLFVWHVSAALESSP